MKKFILSMLSDESGATSTKRCGFWLILITLTAALVLNIIYPKAVAPSPDLVHALEVLASICLGGSVVDKFSKSADSSPVDTPPTPPVQ